ncbi:PREDICTED: uncharacterized protein LOC109363533 [Lupinus angustifolius]|uniref:uncharacterized protein LOC109363533 n=1 Tax=Lupinus angustifolius TaxID=3871 RepID=UPI00092EA8DA|nr:PREDICTED: uncharacterized protein LOC109363533 [Lupinus angustifolius]
MQRDFKERVAQFCNRIISHTNVMKACGELSTDQTIVEKILRTLNPSFDHIVVTIEESKKLEELRIEELQGSLEAHEQRFIERSTEKQIDRPCKPKLQEEEATMARMKIETEIDGKHHSEAHTVKEEMEDKYDSLVLLMMTTSQKERGEKVWYIDSSCSNHMTGHKDWLVNFDSSKKSKVRFADNGLIQGEGTSDVMIEKKNGRKAMIIDVLLVPNMKNNLISLGQLLEKGFSVNMQERFLEVFDSTKRKIMRAPLTQNRTF